MKTNFAIVMCLILIATSCKKDSVLSGNRWRFKDKVYETKISYVDPKSGLSSTNCLLASSYPTGTGEPFCTIDVNFQNLPIVSGIYNIVNAHDSLGPHDVSLGIVINDNLTTPVYLS